MFSYLFTLSAPLRKDDSVSTISMQILLVAAIGHDIHQETVSIRKRFRWKSSSYVLRLLPTRSPFIVNKGEGGRNIVAHIILLMSDQNNNGWNITRTPARAKWIFDSTMEWNLSLHSHPSVVVVLVRRAPRDDSASGSGRGGASGSEWVGTPTPPAYAFESALSPANILVQSNLIHLEILKQCSYNPFIILHYIRIALTFVSSSGPTIWLRC